MNKLCYLLFSDLLHSVRIAIGWGHAVLTLYRWFNIMAFLKYGPMVTGELCHAEKKGTYLKIVLD